MRASERALYFIVGLESFEPEAYKDTGGVWTCGFGHTREVAPSTTCTIVQAIEWMKEDVSIAENFVSKVVTVPMTQNQFDALVSFAYNIGIGAFQKSTLLRKLNAGNLPAIRKEFLRWVYDGKKVRRGLEKRRKCEADLFYLIDS